MDKKRYKYKIRDTSIVVCAIEISDTGVVYSPEHIYKKIFIRKVVK